MTVTEAENADESGLSDKTIVDTREINGIPVTYREIPTIFLPPEGEQPTAEEQAAADRGECFISYGTETREDGASTTPSAGKKTACPIRSVPTMVIGMQTTSSPQPRTL